MFYTAICHNGNNGDIYCNDNLIINGKRKSGNFNKYSINLGNRKLNAFAYNFNINSTDKVVLYVPFNISSIISIDRLFVDKEVLNDEGYPCLHAIITINNKKIHLYNKSECAWLTKKGEEVFYEASMKVRNSKTNEDNFAFIGFYKR